MDDMTVERRQTFTISLENIDSRITLDRDSVDGEVTIMDNEECMYCMYGTFQCSIYLSPVLSSPSVALVTLNRTEYNVIEGNLRLSVCATIQFPDPNEVKCPVDFRFPLIFLSRDYSAGTLMMIQCTLSVVIVSFCSESKHDYKPVSSMLMFEECVRYKCEDVLIMDDVSLEGTEHFVIELDGMSDRIIIDEPNTATVTVFEDDEDGMLSDFRLQYTLIQVVRNI